ncbi:M91 family zinc metallopeptidase [Luteimonas kalidii]|uniref:M91 family zinc metallopeptidase n=1 Tax=Luteimonas kalidii TaxID=3042025 RepID=A0ABT6JV45_9GAMM|nr:M91 family zinc metallopeptidase [Luteimonas kalidii]MDH5834559.1 M91 family zinc metallopeptidase [Luteimonas kalidii]
MSIQTDAGRLSDATPVRTDGYWDDPAAESRLASAADLDRNPVAPDTVDAPPVVSLLPRLAVTEIDGNQSNPDGRTVGQTPDGKDIQVDPLHRDQTVSIARERTLAEAGLGQTYVSSDQLVLSTGGASDRIGVSQRDDGTLDVQVNGQSYALRVADGQELTIRTGAGDDVIEVASNVTVNIVAEGGEGEDTIDIAGSGDNRIDGGDGDDTITLSGSGRNDVFGGNGADEIQGGSGVDVIYGGDGDDRIDGGAGRNYLEGGAGADTIRSRGTGDMVSGGLGDDTLHAAPGASAIYAGAGRDTIEGAGNATTVYAQAVDVVNAATGARPTVINVEIDPQVGSSVTVEGSDAFVQRVQADIEFLRGSPNGQRMLAEFDQTAEARGNSVTIKELSNEHNGFAMPAEDGVTWADVQITNGRAGPGVETDIRYNPSFHMDAFPAPVVVLYHEMSHAYNFANGTLQPGNYNGPDVVDRGISNSERQAVGLETTAAPFDFDGDPATPPTTANPDHLTENGLRGELGLPDRPSYAL